MNPITAHLRNQYIRVTSAELYDWTRAIWRPACPVCGATLRQPARFQCSAQTVAHCNGNQQHMIIIVEVTDGARDDGHLFDV